MNFKHTIFLSLLFASAMTTSGQTAEQCLDFLYASMPQPDKADYSADFYKENILTTLRAKAEMPWGASIPEREFMHFVLPVRVNNENMDRSRMVFYEELKERVKGLTMSDAILEVNHWCHEKVTYTPSDERTSSPLASIRTAYGRCGEESTLLVAALRSVCIPARQVYTPRWAHTDDNHAWVEAWADGQWHFLGACEPEAVLDLGWFNAPASRGMLMHTKAFGNYNGPEEVMQRTKCYTEIDVTANYAPVARRQVRVVDAEGKAVVGATVEFKIYNYAEFYTVSKKRTDSNGMTYMQAGKGDLIAWAYKDGKYGFGKCTMGDEETLTLTLSHSAGERYSEDITIVPPAERNTVPFMTDEQRERNAVRLIREDSIRNAYIATFPTSDNPFVHKARGNYDVIEKYLAESGLLFSPATLLSTLSDKDLRDVTEDVLRDAAFSAENRGYADDIYNRYVLCPRVANEQLTPYRQFFQKVFNGKQQKSFRKDINSIIEWTRKNIQIEELGNPQQLRTTPIGVWKVRECDTFSRNIFFVALARTMGHAARIDAVTQKLEYFEGNEWREIKFEKFNDKSFAAKGLMHVDYTPDEYILNPKYYTHFTLSKINDGAPQLLSYAEEDTWQSTLANPISLDTGDYLLTSGTRMADGSVLAHVEVAPIHAETTTTLPLILPEAEDGVKVIGAFNSENLYHDHQSGVKSLLSTTGRGYYILGIIAPNDEPSHHTLRDIAAVKSDLDALGIHTVLLFRNEEEKSRFAKPDLPPLPSNTHFGTDIDNKIWDEICTNMHLTSQTLPVFIIADTFNRLVFISQGYTIGIGERLTNVVKRIKIKN